ncbi:hypothetical protein E1181_08705 [Saccharopolyspora terrae]|uniref:Uncharacterized protein n=1 Tax=Saccharopolyspora terrae TaxID=2530384 RepID=A0A4V2YBJ6_9PSEU|nr:hypothetical protein E1181_08705 [Saccharopolyspora terrae]
MAGIERRPSGPVATTSASSARAAAQSSAAGSACASEPPTVPRVRIWWWPTWRSASTSSGQVRATRGEVSTARWRVAGPITSSSPSRCRSAMPGRRVMSTSALGRASRKFIIGSRLCPPARSLASSSAASSAIASVTVPGRT